MLFFSCFIKEKRKKEIKHDKKILTQTLLSTSRVISPYRVIRINKKPINGKLTPNQFDSAEQVKVSILDIGQGDAILIQSTKENILIDGKNKGQGKNVIQYLKKFNVKQLNAVISTHPDADHIGGLADVIDAFPVKSVFAPRVTHTTIAYRNLLQSVNAKQLKIHVAKEENMLSFNSLVLQKNMHRVI